MGEPVPVRDVVGAELDEIERGRVRMLQRYGLIIARTCLVARSPRRGEATVCHHIERLGSATPP
jgi:hypothetical protein